MAITLRLAKGTELTYSELDGNFTDLDTRLQAIEATNIQAGDLQFDTDMLFSNKMFSENAVDVEASLTSLATAQYDGTVIYARDTGRLYVSANNNWKRVLLEDDADLADIAFSGSFNDVLNLPTSLSGYGIVDDISSLSDNQNLLFSGRYTDLTNKPNFSAIALSGEWADVNNAPAFLEEVPGDLTLDSLRLGEGALVGFIATYEAFQTNGDDGSLPTVKAVIDAINDIALTDLKDVTADSTALQDGQVLAWNSATNDFQGVTINQGDTIGNFTIANSNIDTDDSSTITITPAVVAESDLTVQNDLVVNGNIVTEATGTPEVYSETSILLTATDRVEVTQSPFKLANLTEAQRDALTAENGDMIYNTTSNKLQGYQNGSWINLDGTV
jgi:hypothetical protein